MNSLYITSIENYSGKTAVCLAIGKMLQARNHKIGYLKPVSYQPMQVDGLTVDEDANFIKKILDLPHGAWDLSPVIVTPQVLSECLKNQICNLDEKIREAYRKISEDIDVMLLEGGASLRMGYAIGLSAPQVSDMLDARVLVVVKFRGQMRVLDDALTAQFRLGDKFAGVLINRVPDADISFVKEQAVPFLEKQGIAVLGVLPDQPNLAAISVGEMVQTLGAEVLTNGQHEDALAETMMVGAMGSQEALSRFRKYQNKGVITGGDRIDVQLAALETSTVVLILTGNLRPEASVLNLAEQQGVAVLLVPTNTMETVETLERAFGRTHLGHAGKLATFETLMAQNLDAGRLLKLIGIA
ncbi:MAG: phosphotransacetylase family protein [Anaerolineae bacterium]|nr:phosphotransacetylase family protein [Anaerolineae bacterium]